jgi:glycerol-3-phosphate O-acyltransferase
VRGRNVDFRRLAEAQRFAEVEILGKMLMAAVAKVVPVLPVSLVATVLLRAGAGGMSEDEIRSGAETLIAQLRARGAHVHVPRQDVTYMVHAGLRMLRLRRLVARTNGRHAGDPRETVLLRYYANAIAHHFAAPPAGP